MNDQAAIPNSTGVSWEAFTEGAPGRNSWVSSQIRVAELIFDASRALTLQVQFEGSTRALPIRMQQVQSPGSYSPTLLIRLRTGALDGEPWFVGGTVTVWYAKRDGFFAFRTAILAESRDALLLAMPEGVLRHSRRRQQRYRIPSQISLPIVVATADGMWQKAQALSEISTGGLSALFPADLPFETGTLMRLGLRLQADRITVVNARVRHVQPEGDELQSVGLEFIDLAPMVRLALERYFLKTRAAPLPDVVTGHYPALPEGVRSQLAQISPTDRNPTSPTRPKR